MPVEVSASRSPSDPGSKPSYVSKKPSTAPPRRLGPAQPHARHSTRLHQRDGQTRRTPPSRTRRPAGQLPGLLTSATASGHGSEAARVEGVPSPPAPTAARCRIIRRGRNASGQPLYRHAVALDGRLGVWGLVTRVRQLGSASRNRRSAEASGSAPAGGSIRAYFLVVSGRAWSALPSVRGDQWP